MKAYQVVIVLVVAVCVILVLGGPVMGLVDKVAQGIDVLAALGL